MKKTYDITVGEITYQLRMTVGVQRRLEEKYKTSGMKSTAIALSAIEAPTVMADVLGLCLTWVGNTNPRISGDDFYDLLVDEDIITDVVGRAEIVTGIMVKAGLISEDTASTMMRNITDGVDAIGSSGEEPEENPL